MIAEKTMKLVEMGLAEKEAAVYLTLLYGGAMTAEKAAKQAKLNRSTTYVQIKELMDLGLVSTFKVEKKTFFAAESPTNLERIIEKKRRDVERQMEDALTLVPDLLKIYSNTGSRPIFRIFEGKEGLISMRNSILESGVKEYYLAFSVDVMQQSFTDNEMIEFSKRRQAKGIAGTVLYTWSKGELPAYPPQRLKRIDIEKYPFGSDLYIYGDTVSIATTMGQITGLTITNAAIAQSMKSIFMMAWDNLEEKK